MIALKMGDRRHFFRLDSMKIRISHTDSVNLKMFESLSLCDNTFKIAVQFKL